MENQEPDLIAAILSGELDENAPEVRRALDAQPALRAELEDLRRLQASLEGDAAEVRGALAQTPSGGEGRVPRSAATRRTYVISAVVAAVALAAAFVLLFVIAPRSGDEDPPTLPGEGQMLGGGDLEFERLEPQGPGSSFETFRAVAPIPAGARVEIAIWSAAAPERAKPLYVHRETRMEAEPSGFHWSPDPEVLASLGSAIRWDLLVLDVNGEVIGVARGLRANR